MWALHFCHTQPYVFAGMDATYKKRTGKKIPKRKVHSVKIVIKSWWIPSYSLIGYKLLKGDIFYCLFHRF